MWQQNNLTCEKTVRKNIICEKIQIVIILINSSCDKTQKLKLEQNSNCEKAQELKLGQN